MSHSTSAQLSLGISSHNNRFLFSDHYLNTILKTDPRWRAAIATADALLPALIELYEKEKGQLANYCEAQLEENWFKPIFNILGHTFDGLARIPGLSTGIKFPDYVFFPDDASRQGAVARQSTPDYVRQALAVGEV
ncbi:MAG: hypothetical protein KDE59_30985 [Anaerolineales bacterium]|nr:hypothetical protein [Anaerolineales bacterium]